MLKQCKKCLYWVFLNITGIEPQLAIKEYGGCPKYTITTWEDLNCEWYGKIDAFKNKT